MRGLSTSLAAATLATALFAPAWGWAGKLLREPASDWTMSCDGNATTTGFITGWSGEYDTFDGVYVPALCGQGATIAVSGNQKFHPYASGLNLVSGSTAAYTLALYADISAVATENASSEARQAVLWAVGSKSTGISLCKTGANEVAVVTATTSGSTTTRTVVQSYSSEALASGFHLLMVSVETTADATVLKLYVDGNAGSDPEGGAITTRVQPGSKIQLGAVYGGIDTSTCVQGYGMIIDEARGYSSVLAPKAADAADGTFEQVVAAFANLYTRTLSGEAAWSVEDGWKKAADGTQVAAPGAGATCLLTLEADATLPLPTTNVPTALEVSGAYTLTLTGSETASCEAWSASGTTIRVPKSVIPPANVKGSGRTIVQFAANETVSDTLASVKPTATGDFLLETMNGVTVTLSKSGERTPPTAFSGMGGEGNISVGGCLNFTNAFNGKEITLFGDITFTDNSNGGINAGHGSTKATCTLIQTSGTISGGRVRSAAWNSTMGHSCTYNLRGGECATPLLKHFAVAASVFTVNIEGGKLTGALTKGDTNTVMHVINLSSGTLATAIPAGATVNISGGTVEIPASTAIDLSGATFSGAGASYTFKSGSSLTIPAAQVGTVTVPADGSLKLILTAEELATGSYTTSGVTVTEGGTLAFAIYKNGAMVSLTEDDATVVKNEDGTYTVTLGGTWWKPTVNAGTAEAPVYNWNEAQNWSTGTIPTAESTVRLGTSTYAPTLTADVTVAKLELATGAEIALGGYSIQANTIQSLADGGSLALTGTGTLKHNSGGTTPPLLSNVALSFADEAKWDSYGWPEISGTVSIEVVGATKELTLTTTSAWGVSLAGSGTLVKEGEGKLILPVKPTNGFAGPITISAGTLSLAAGNNGDTTNGTNEGSLSGVISGSGALEIASGTVTLTGANTYTGGTTIASGAVASLSNDSALSTGTIEGTGKVVYTCKPASDKADFTDSTKWTGTVSLSGEWNETPFSRLGNAKSTLEINGLTGWCSNDSHTFKEVHVVGSGFVINNGTSSQTTTFNATLKGTGPITMNKPNGAPTYTLRFAGDCSEYAGDVTVATTSGNLHCLCFGATVARKDGTIQVGSDASVKVASGKTWTALNGISVSGTIGGTGTIASALTLASGATLDASGATADGCLTLGSVTMPAEGTVTLTLPETGSDGLAVVKCTSPSTVLAGLSATPPKGYLLGTTDVAVVLKQPTLPSGSGSDSGALSSGAAAALREVAAAAGLPTISAVSGTTCTGKGEEATALDAATLSSALEVFSGIATADEANSTISVVYDFGIATLTQGNDGTITVGVAICDKDGAAAALADGASLELLADGAALSGVTFARQTDGTYAATIATASLAGKTLSVRAKKGASGN